jgi:DNA-binding response OmpR family regulator
MKILVVDDDAELSGLVAFALKQAGYFVLEAADGVQGLQVVGAERPDLVILDVNMPRLNGFEVLQRLRADGIATPVLMLTVRSSEEDQVHALDLGADDFLTKPFSPRTLLARVRALLRRVGVEKPLPISTGDIVLDPELQTVRMKGGDVVSLTRLEFRLLQFLVANAGHALPAERLTSHVWGYRGMGDRQVLKQLVHRLRQKLESDPAEPAYLVTVAGVGYVLRTEPGSEPA